MYHQIPNKEMHCLILIVSPYKTILLRRFTNLVSFFTAIWGSVRAYIPSFMSCYQYFMRKRFSTATQLNSDCLCSSLSWTCCFLLPFASKSDLEVMLLPYHFYSSWNLHPLPCQLPPLFLSHLVPTKTQAQCKSECRDEEHRFSVLWHFQYQDIHIPAEMAGNASILGWSVLV